MRLPDHLDQGESVVQLFADVSALFQEYLALPRELAQQVTLWMTSTWLADVVPSPPVLLISGPHMGRAVDLCGGVQSFGSPAHQWMRQNAPLYGWFHPSWAAAGGSLPEPWHWEYAG